MTMTRILAAAVPLIVALSACTAEPGRPAGPLSLEVLSSGEIRLGGEILRPEDLGAKLEDLRAGEREAAAHRGPDVALAIDPQAPWGAVLTTQRHLDAALGPGRWSGNGDDRPWLHLGRREIPRSAAFVVLGPDELIRVSREGEETVEIADPENIEGLARSLLAEKRYQVFVVEIGDSVPWHRGVAVFDALLRARAEYLFVAPPGTAAAALGSRGSIAKTAPSAE
jgi:hypothetical protein